MATSAEKREQRKFGGALKAMRKAAGLTQTVLAEKASLHRTYVSELERGCKEPVFTYCADSFERSLEARTICSA